MTETAGQSVFRANSYQALFAAAAAASLAARLLPPFYLVSTSELLALRIPSFAIGKEPVCLFMPSFDRLFDH